MVWLQGVEGRAVVSFEEDAGRVVVSIVEGTEEGVEEIEGVVEFVISWEKVVVILSVRGEVCRVERGEVEVNTVPPQAAMSSPYYYHTAADSGIADELETEA